jgi:predicted aspartyl protease
MKHLRLTQVVIVFVFAASHRLSAQREITASQRQFSTGCSLTVPEPAVEADVAFRNHDFANSQTLYSGLLESATTEEQKSRASAGIIRSLIAAGKLTEALEVAKKAVADHPKDARLLDVLGEVYFRRGEPNEALEALQASIHTDPCTARTHYDLAQFLKLSGMYASGLRELEIAERLSPRNKTFAQAAAPRLNGDERIHELMERLETQDLSIADRAAIQHRIQILNVKGEGSCELVRPVDSTKLAIVPLSHDSGQSMYGAGLVLKLNGHQRRFKIDSGASGLYLSKSAAASLGLTSEAEGSASGLGNDGSVRTMLAHVENLRIGELEFHNCLVHIAEKGDRIVEDGLIGLDVFSSWVVTLDIPSREIRLSPLPKRPLPTSAAAELKATAGPATSELGPQDRYVAPEMSDWTRAFRFGHFLILPTRIGNAPVKLFILDTGADTMLVSPAAAREVTKVETTDASLHGISGKVKNVSQASRMTITFAKVSQQMDEVPAVDTFTLTHRSGVEVSGYIGFPMLRELIISIDYRDNLVHVVYDPEHGAHRR